MRIVAAGVFALCVGILLNPAPASAHGYKRKSIEIVHPWTGDKTEPGGHDAIVSMDIKNTGKAADKLVSATSPVAAKVEIHSGAGANAIEIAPGARVELTAKTQHLRMIGLKKSLTAYDTLPVTLVFKRVGRIKIDVLVEETSDPRN